MDRTSQAPRSRRVYAFLMHKMLGLCLLVVLASVIGAGMGPNDAQERKTTQSPSQKPIDFRNPPREYKRMRLDHWTVYVEKQLLSDDPRVAWRALQRMKVMLPKALAALPEHSHSRLTKLPIYLMYGPEARAGGRENRFEYFGKDSPKYSKHLDPGWSDCVVIYCADDYVCTTNFSALTILIHEFAHAYHLEQWSAKQPDILRAWEHAVEQGLYRNVRDVWGEQIEKAYSLKNQNEYFAELSCMYFLVCEYYPFDRKRLKTYDPVGYAMIQKMWHVKE